jgi:hypothetical protein
MVSSQIFIDEIVSIELRNLFKLIRKNSWFIQKNFRVEFFSKLIQKFFYVGQNKFRTNKENFRRT